MRWEVAVASPGGRPEGRSVTVEGPHWRVALLAGLRLLGERVDPAAGLTVEILDGGYVVIRRPGARGGIWVRNLDHVAPPPVVPVPSSYPVHGMAAVGMFKAPLPSVLPVPAGAAPADAASAAPRLPGLPAHQVFFTRDEDPGEESSLCYRERLIAVPAGAVRDGINALLMAYFEGLRAEVQGRDEAKYVNIAVFDHAFSARAERPALAALSWKSWRSEVPEVIYPMDQPSVPSYAPPPFSPAAAASAPAGVVSAPPPPRAAQARAITPAAARAVAPPAPAPSPARTPARVPAIRRRIPTPADLARLGRPDEEAIINEILANVFDDMFGLLSCRTREASAEFAIDVAFRRIPCEAGSVLLSDINSRDLVFTAVRGASAVRLKGQRLAMGKGIVGYAAKVGATVAVPDVKKDPRFSTDIDTAVGFHTRSVIASPLVHDGQTFGAIELLNRTGVDTFLKAEIAIISYIASMLAEHLATAIPTGELDFAAEEAMEREKAEEAKRRSRAPSAKKHAPRAPARVPAPAVVPAGKKRRG